MAYDFSSLLSMAQAHFVSEAAQPQQKDEQLTVFWENIPPQLLREAREWLVDNRLSVADFTVEHKQYEGTWHLVSLQAGEQVKTGRVQAVFQKGYATSLTWALARLTNAKLAHTNASTAGVADSSSDNPIRYLNVRFPNIDRRAVNSIISGIATTYTNVQISYETYSGEWHVVYATSGLQQEGQKDNDGAAFIEIFLAKPQYTLQTKRSAGTPQERTVWYCWDVPQAIAQSVIDTFEGTGTSVSANNNSAQNLVDLILESSTPESGQRFSLSSVACSQRVYDYVYRSVSNPDVYALPSTSTDGVIYSREEALNDDGTYNVFIKATLSRSRIFEFESFSAPFASESTISYRANTGVIQAPPSGSGGVYRLRQDVNPDCTYDADLTYKAGLNAGEAIFGSERGGLSTEDRAVYRDRTSQVTAPEPGQRGIYQADNQLTEEGLYNSTLQYRTSTARELEFESQATKFRRQSEHVYRNSDTPITAPIPGAGGLYRVEQQINPDLTYDARLVYTAGNSQGQAKFNSQSSELVTEASIIYRDIQGQIDAPSASQGQIYQATNQLTDEGLYNASLQYQVSRPDVAKFKSQATKFRSESTITYRNSRAVIEAPTPSASGVYRVSQRENQDGTYDAELTYSSGTNAGEVSFTSEKSSLLDEDTAIYKDRSSKVDANSSSQGVVYQATNQLTDEGLYNAQVIGRASKQGKIDFRSRSTPFKLEQVSTYRNTKTMPSVPSVNTGAYQMSAQLNADGTYDVSVAYTTKSNSPGRVDFSSEQSSLSVESTSVYKDRDQKVEAPASGRGYIYRSDNQLTDEGLYNATLQYRVSQQGTANFQSRITPFKREDSRVYRNYMTMPDIPDTVNTGAYQLSAQLNQDGTYDASVSYTTKSSSSGRVDFASEQSSLLKESTSVYKDRDQKIEAPASGQGYIYRADNQMTEDGLYNSTIQYRASQEGEIDFLSRLTPFKKEQSRVYRNYSTLPDIGESVNTGAYQVSAQLNSDGTYDFSVAYVSPSDSNSEISFASTESQLLKEATAIYKDAKEKQEAPASGQGYIYQADNQVTDDGLYNSTIQYRASQSGELDFVSRVTPFKKEDTRIYRNQTAVPSWPVNVDTGSYQISGQLNQDGTYDFSVVYTSPSDTSAECTFTSETSELSEEATVIYKDSNENRDAPTSGQGYVYRLDTQITEEGLYNTQIAYRASKEGQLDFLSRRTPFKKEDTTIYRNQRAIPSFPADVDTGSYQISGQLNADGTYDFSMSYTSPADSSAECEFESETSELLKEATVIYKDSDQNRDAPASGQGYIYRLDTQLTDEGLYNTQVIYRASQEGDLDFVSRVTPFKKEDTRIYKNQRAIPSIPSDVDTGSYQISGQLNQDGTYDFSVSYTSPADTSAECTFKSERSELLEEATTIYKDSNEKRDAPSSAQGYIYRADTQITEDGLYNTQITYRASQQGDLDFLSRLTPFKKEDTRVYRNQTAVPSWPSEIDTGQYQISGQLNQDGTYDFSVAYTSAKDTSTECDYTSEEATLLKEQTVIYKDSGTKRDAPASGQGYIYRADTQLTEEGLYNTQITYRASQKGDIEFLSRLTPFKKEDTKIYRNQTTMPTWPSDVDTGQYQISGQLNQDGTYDFSMAYTSAKDSSSECTFRSLASSSLEEATTIYKDNNTNRDAPADGQGFIYRLDTQITDEGLYNTQVTYRASKKRSDSITTGISKTVHRHAHVYENETQKPNISHIGSGLYDINSFRFNDDGTYSWQVLYSIKKEITAKFDQSNTGDEKEVGYIYSGRTSVLDAPAAADGVNYSVEQAIEDDGTYSARLSVSEVVYRDTEWIKKEDDDGEIFKRVATNITSADRDSILGGITTNYSADWSVTPSRFKDRYNVSVAMRYIPSDLDTTDKGGKNLKYNLTVEGETYGVDIKITRNRTVAKNHMTGNTVGVWGGEVAGIKWLGRGWWKAVKLGPNV